MPPTSNSIIFPHPEQSDEQGLLAIGGDLSTGTLLNAYHHGIFPWFNHDDPILWWSPDPRMVLKPQQVHISKNIAKKWRQARYNLHCDTAFEEVIHHCAVRKNSDTWLIPKMQKAYHCLHQKGFAHSIEVWCKNKLVGGLYGVVLGNVFFGESMFSLEKDTSKLAFIALAKWAEKQKFTLIDCQVSNPHLLQLGAKTIPRKVFLQYMNQPIRASYGFSAGFDDFITKLRINPSQQKHHA